MKKITLFTILGLVASLALADTVYYPGNTYKVDGKVQFINLDERPTVLITKDNVQTNAPVATMADLAGTSGEIEERLDALEGTVGDSTKGLVKDVDDLAGDLSAAESDIDDLQTTVGDNNSGLVKDVNDLETTVGDNNSGLVKDVNDLKTDVGELETTVGDENSGLVKDVDDLQGSVSDLETTVGDENSGLVKDVDDLQTIVGDENSGLVKDVADLQAADYVNTFKVQNGTARTGDITLVPGENIKIADSNGSFTIANVDTPERSINITTNKNSPISTTGNAEQSFTWAESGSAVTNSLALNSAATATKVGTLTIYLTEDYSTPRIYKIDNQSGNIVGLPATQFWADENAESDKSVWKLEFESIPESTKWYFRKATEFIITPKS